MHDADMKEAVDRPDLYSDWPQDRQRMRSNTGPRGSPLGKRRKEGHQTMNGVFDSESMCTGGNIPFQAKSSMEAHGERASKAVRKGLSTVNEAVGGMIADHVKEVDELKRNERKARKLLDEEKERTRTLEESLKTAAKRVGEVSADVEKLQQRQRDFETRNRRLLKRMRESRESSDRKINDLKADVSMGKKREANLQEKLDRPQRAFQFIQSQRVHTQGLLFDIDVDFRTVLKRYAEITNQNAARLTGRLYRSMETIDLDYLFMVG